MSTLNGATLTAERGRPALRLERRLPHSVERVWDVVSERGRLSEWYPFPAVELDPRPGGRIVFDDGEGTVMEARITEFEPPRLFAFSEHAPDSMPRESDDLVRLELSPLQGGDGGCLLFFTHVFDDRPAAAGYAAGWQRCLDVLGAVAGGQRAEPVPPGPELHQRYAAAFGLSAGRAEDTAEGWRVRFERQLTRPAGFVWSRLVTPGMETDEAVPELMATEEFPAGAVDAVEPLSRVEYDWLAEGLHPAGRVCWELSPGTGHGARLTVTVTGPADRPEYRAKALRVWEQRVEALAAELAEHG